MFGSNQIYFKSSQLKDSCKKIDANMSDVEGRGNPVFRMQNVTESQTDELN